MSKNNKVIYIMSIPHQKLLIDDMAEERRRILQGDLADNVFTV